MPASINADTQAILLWSSVFIGAVALLGAAIWAVRRWALSKGDTSCEDGWSLQHLRDLKAAGQLSNEEFESLKARTLQSVTSGASRKSRASTSGEIGRPPGEGI